MQRGDRTHVLLRADVDSWQEGQLGCHQHGLVPLDGESGIQQVKPILPDIFSLEILTVDGHEKNGNYVPSHLHLNITYLLMADDHAPLRCKPDENKDVAWFPIETAIAQSSEPWFRERIYAKLNRKLLAILPELKHQEH